MIRTVEWFPTSKPHLIGLLIGIVVVALGALYIALKRNKPK
jgi:hypothetical protein